MGIMLGLCLFPLASYHPLFVKHLLHRNEEGIQINMEDTASHETVYKIAHKADQANFHRKVTQQF